MENTSKTREHMRDSALNIFNNEARAEWVRLRTLIYLRWLAIVGQTLAVFIAIFWLKIDLWLGACILAISASVLVNLVATFLLPETRRLSQLETIAMLLFDICQLGLLLIFTGGINNPFTLLILAPVTISATALTMSATIFLGLIAIGFITFMIPYHVDLVDHLGNTLELPVLFQWGNWAALLIGITFLGGYARRVTIETFSMSEALAATELALDREHQLSLVGGVVAAAAHEMGTPLATIKLAASELEEELSDRKDLAEDLELIQEQTDRLRQILRDMGQTGKDDLFLKSAPLITVVKEAATPHRDRGKAIHFLINGEVEERFEGIVPDILRNAEIVHGIRNLVQNAVDFSASAVWIDCFWTNKEIGIRVADNGKGYPAELLGRLGDPFLPRRGRKKTAPKSRRDYEGMGLGVFIAKTLLERSGASITFANATSADTHSFEQSDLPGDMANAIGAIVSVQWMRQEIEKSRGGLGPNERVKF